MNHPPAGPGPGPEPDDDLRRLVVDAAEAHEPSDRLAALRSRTSSSPARGARGRRGSWLAWPAAGVAAASVVAGVVAGVVLARPDAAPEGASPPVASDPSGSSEGGALPRGGSVARRGTTPVYYVGPGGSGPDAPEAALYRYFEPVGDPLTLLTSEPTDPDYSTRWAPGSLLSWDVVAGRIEVTADVDGARVDELAAQQLVYTLQAAVGRRLPVRLLPAGGEEVQLARAPELAVLPHVSISDPGEGFVYDRGFTARGVAHGFEGTVACEVADDGGRTRWQGVTTAGSPAASRLTPWRLPVPVTGLEPGRYVLTCRTDAGSSTEGLGAATDTRTIVVE